MRKIDILFRKRPRAPIAARIRRVVNRVFDILGQDQGEVHILITDDEEIRELNRGYRKIDTSTDVLSFPDGDLLPQGHPLIGQIVISLETARRQASGQDHDEITEIEELLIHGLLHLLGWDHTEDQGEMDTLELRLRKECLR